jgi:restriction system protein
MKNYYRIMAGRKSIYAPECFEGRFIGADFGIEDDLTGKLHDNWRSFNEQYIPVYMANRPEKTKIAAGLACGTLWTICKGIQAGDIVLCPNGAGSYFVGTVVSDYSFHAGEVLPHRRSVNWYDKTIDRGSMSESLRNSTGSIGTSSLITKHAQEIELLLSGAVVAPLMLADTVVESPVLFGLEKHLEEFLVHNWKNTEFGRDYDIFEEDGELAGQQYPSDTGPIDILAISKDKKELLVIELKRGRASDSVVGQIQRYMGYVLEELAEPGQKVKGVIVALEDDLRVRRALAVTNNIEFYRYQINFKLIKS